MIKLSASLLLVLTSIINLSISEPVLAATNTKQSIEVEINSLHDLMDLFAKYNYTRKAWKTGHREVPRLSFNGVSEKWKETSSHIPVQQKKQVFFRLMAPLVLISNENILAERSIVKIANLSSPDLLAIAKKYHLTFNPDKGLTEEQRTQLLDQVDIMPPSLALAQAAEESGWATSRFTEEGNAFFGQWDFSGKGMAPKQQRKELGNYGLARFDSPLSSVEGYMLNINTTAAYKKLRVLRAKLRQENKAITGIELAGTLDKYSERGQAYIDGLRSMIRYNKLQDVDDAYLSNTILIKLVVPK